MSGGFPCPICGESLPVAAPHCAECGAILPPELRAAPPPSGTVFQPTPSGEKLQDDDLLRAFRAQFEERQIELPAPWARRLEQLAGETENSRRMATIVFIDLRGYTTLVNRLGEEQVDRLRKWFFDVCTRRIALHGGFIIQFLGDAAFAAFGAPWAFERDTESALRAVLEIREEVRERGEIEGFPLAIRAGADCGSVSVRLTSVQGQLRPDLFGPAVNLAARLEEAARTWEILISDTLAEQVRGLFELTERPRFAPRNYSREVTPWAVVAHREEAATRRVMDVPLVGRESELAQLNAWLGAAARGPFVNGWVIGPAGIGKTRLVHEALGPLHAPRRVDVINCEPHDRHIPLGIARELLERLSRPEAQELEKSPPTSRRRLQILIEYFPRLERETIGAFGYVLGVEPYLGGLKSLPGAMLRAQVLSAFTRLIEVAARHFGDWVLFIDDIHWCDPLTLEILQSIAGRRPGGLCLLAALRAEVAAGLSVDPRFESAPEALLAAETWPARESLQLGPIPRAAAADLLRRILNLDKLPPHMRAQLLDETEGNPLYMIEMGIQLGRAIGDDLAAALATRADREERIPLILRELLQARIDRLDSHKRALLQHGAIIGRSFSLGMIGLIEETQGNLLAELYALKGLSMLREEPMPEDILFRFTPSLLREVAYEMLTSDQRRRLHRTIAERIEQRYVDRLDDFAYELALHWTLGSMPSQARRFLRVAALRAIALGCPRDALNLVRHALDLPDLEDAPVTPQFITLQQRALLNELAGRASRALGDFSASTEYFEQFRRIAASIGHDPWQAAAEYQLAHDRLEQGEAEPAGETLVALLHDGRLDPPLARRVEVTLGIVRLRTGRIDEALGHFMNVAHAGDVEFPPPHICGDAWNNAGLVRWQRGETASAREAFERALGIWRAVGNRFGQVSSLSNLGMTHEQAGEFNRAQQTYQQALEQAEECGYLHAISAVEANLANLAILRQAWEEAERRSSRALHFARMINHRNSESIALENLGLALGGRGLIDESRANLDQAAALGEAMGDPARRDSARLAAAWIALLAGDADGAREQVARLDGDLSPDLVAWRRTIADACDALQNGDAQSWLEFAESGLDEIRSAPLIDYLHQLDAMLLLVERGVLPMKKDDILRQRRLCLAG